MTTENMSRPHIPYYPRFIDCNAGDYDPKQVLEGLFEEYSLEHFRELLWKMFASAIQDQSEFSEWLKRANMLFFYTRISDMITAAYLIAEVKEKRPAE